MLQLLFIAVLFCTIRAYSQQHTGSTAVAAQQVMASLPDAPDPVALWADSADLPVNQQTIEKPPQQPRRILGIMPNYRAVSTGAVPPPPTPKEAFKIATANTFDYSSFVFVGLTSLIAEGNDSHPRLGKGVPGFWGYYWRGFVDKADGNYWVIFALPTAFHEDERYYTLGEGSILKRAAYAASRVAITRNYDGHNTVNGAELLGRGIAEGISTTYYPASDRTVSSVASKYAYALMRDAATNAFREFWPDIAAHVRHRHP